jgi:hypothetical protein
VRCPPGDRPPARFHERDGTIDRRDQPNRPGQNMWLIEDHRCLSGPGDEYHPRFGERVDESTWKDKSSVELCEPKPGFINGPNAFQ